MRVRFQADADLNQIIVTATLRRVMDIDFRTAHAEQLAGLSDPAVLLRAAQVGRILVTHDQSTMPVHFADFLAAHTSPGALIVPRHYPVRQIVDDLITIWAATDAEEWINRLMYLPL
jgi:hypothetical protein